MKYFVLLLASILVLACDNVSDTRNNTSDKEEKYCSLSLHQLDSVIRLDSNDADAYYSRALILKKSESTMEKAFNDFDKAIKLGLKKADAFYNRGRLRTFVEIGSLLDRKSVMEDLNMAIQLDSTLSDAYFLRARMTIELWEDSVSKTNGNIDIIPNFVYLKAISDMSLSIKYDSTAATAFFMRARFRCELGDKIGANADYKTAYRLDPFFLDNCK